MPYNKTAVIRVATLLLAAAAISSTLTAATLDTAGFVRRSSTTVTPTWPTQPFGTQQNVVGLPLQNDLGYCLAWVDRRQGGQILATRIDGSLIVVPPGTDPASVRLIDPLGIPIALGDTPPVVLLESASGCVAVIRRPDTLEGVLIPHSGDQTRTIFTIPDPGEFVVSSRRAAVFQRPQSGSTLLTQVTAEGVTTQRAGAPELLSAAFADERLFVASRESSGVTIWEASRSLELKRVAGGIDGDASTTVRMASNGSDLIVVSSGSPAGSTPYAVTHLSFGGAVLHQFNSAIPAGGVLRRVQHERTYLIEWTTTSGTWAVETKGVAVDTQYGIPFLKDHLVLGAAGPFLHVWDTGREGVEFELTGGTPARRGYPITFSPQPEMLVDASAGSDEVALLWYEILPVEKKQQLSFGLYDKLSGKLSISRQLTQEAYDPANLPSGAVVLRDRVVMMAWSDEDGLWFQRLHVDGTWIDKNPRLLRARAAALGPIELTPHGLDVSDRGFHFVWTEWKDSRTTTLAAAVVGFNGIATNHAVTVNPHTDVPAHAAIAATSRGHVIGWADLAVALPPLGTERVLTVNVALFDETFVFKQALTPDGSLTAITRPVLASGGGTVLFVSDQYAFLYGDVGLSVWGKPIRFDLSVGQQRFTDVGPRSSILWTGFDYVIATHAFRRTSGPASTVSMIAPDGALTTDIVPPVPDWTMNGVLPFTPYAFFSGRELFLFGSEVFADEDSGSVRRLRISKFGTPVRRRSVGK